MASCSSIGQRGEILSSTDLSDPEKYEKFKNYLDEFAKFQPAAKFPDDFMYQYAFSIIYEKTNFEFDDEDERLSSTLLKIAAIYLHVYKDAKISFISPTDYYAKHAQRMALVWLNLFAAIENTPREDYYKRFAITVPGYPLFDQVIRMSTILFMHGKDFSEHLPKGWEGRKIIQIFPREYVPVDPRNCSCSCRCYDGCSE